MRSPARGPMALSIETQLSLNIYGESVEDIAQAELPVMESQMRERKDPSGERPALNPLQRSQITNFHAKWNSGRFIGTAYSDTTRRVRVVPRSRATQPLQGRELAMQPAHYLVHFSNVLLLVAYSVRDILWLRWFAVAAALTVIPYFLVQDQVLWPPVLWGGGVHSDQPVSDRAHLYGPTAGELSADEQRLYDLVFDSLRPREFLSLALVGEWRDAAAGEQLLTALAKPAARVCIAISGDIEVRSGETSVGSLAPGHLVGTALVLTGNPSPVDARFVAAGRYIGWSTQTLRVLLDKRPDLRVALQQVTSRDLAAKLERSLVVRVDTGRSQSLTGRRGSMGCCRHSGDFWMRTGRQYLANDEPLCSHKMRGYPTFRTEIRCSDKCVKFFEYATIAKISLGSRKTH